MRSSLILALFLFFSGEALAESAQERLALNKTLEAFLKVSPVDEGLQNTERWCMQQIEQAGIDRKLLMATASIAGPFITQRISTREFNTGFALFEFLIVRPDLEYKFASRETTVGISFSWR